MKKVRYFLDRYQIAWVVLLCALALFIFSASTAHAAQPTACNTFHFVQPGQTLFSIGLSYGVTVADMMTANPAIMNPNILPAGAWLCVPPPGLGTGGPEIIPPIACRTYHNITFGQTLYSIGRFYGVHYQILAQVNGIPNVDIIYAGDTLCIP